MDTYILAVRQINVHLLIFQLHRVIINTGMFNDEIQFYYFIYFVLYCRLHLILRQNTLYEENKSTTSIYSFIKISVDTGNLLFNQSFLPHA